MTSGGIEVVAKRFGDDGRERLLCVYGEVLHGADQRHGQVDVELLGLFLHFYDTSILFA